jgi:hypothetical protein
VSFPRLGWERPLQFDPGGHIRPLEMGNIAHGRRGCLTWMQGGSQIAWALVVVCLSGCRPSLDASDPSHGFDASVEQAVSRAGVMPGRIVSYSIEHGRFLVIYETDDETRRYRLEGTIDDGGPVFERICEISNDRCLDLEPAIWDEGPAPVSA